jgi:hypothetical protein
MEASGAPPTPTIDSLVAEVEALAQHAAQVFLDNPKVQEVQQKIADVADAIEVARAEQPAEEAPPA